MQRGRVLPVLTLRVVLVCFFATLLFLSYSPAQQGAHPPNSRGGLEIAGKMTPLDFAYAVPQRNGEMLVILSDKTLGTKELKDVFARIHLADSGEVHLVEITLDKDKSPISVSVRHNAFMTNGGGLSTDDTYEAEKSDKNTIAGRFYRKRPGEFDGVTYSYDATIKASIWAEPPPTFAGEAAKNSPQGKVALALLKAGRAGDAKAIRKLLTEDDAKDLDGPMGKDILEMMKMGPDPRKSKIMRVDVAGENADVTFEQSSKNGVESTTIHLRLVNGEWKVASK
jgi:hypothetical protein